MLTKEIFEKNFTDSLNKNFPSYSKYFNFEYRVFFELTTSVFQVTKCMILELHFATITLTNHILERLLKLALISKAVGIKGIPTEDWNATFALPNEKYGSLMLGNSIEQCLKEGLITESEKNYLFDIIRTHFRNGFSHADINNVLKGFPETTQGFQGTFNSPGLLKPISLNSKVIPTIQTMQMESFAKSNANNYFDFVFNLLGKIEARIIEFDK